MLSIGRLAYRVGRADKRYAEFYNRGFMGIFPEPISHLFRRWDFVALYLRFLEIYCVSLLDWTSVVHATDQQPQ